MDSILALSVTQNISDLHLSCGHCPVIRKNGQLNFLNDMRFNKHDLEQKILSLLNPLQQSQLEQNKQIDFTYQNTLGRFRINIFYQSQGLSAAIRIIQKHIPSLSDINAPAVLSSLIENKQGLVLVTGATGSGKSTTIAALVEYINHNYAKHIITLEDPIEFIYHSQQSLIQQREIQTNVASFELALQALLRQDPDIIVIGELRSLETIQLALTAAETGHLVLATLHTNSAIQSIERLVDVFSGDVKPFIRAQLAMSIKAIVSQQLVINQNRERIAVFEILVNTPAIANLIREGKVNQIFTLLETGKQFGMQTMTQALASIQQQI